MLYGFARRKKNRSISDRDAATVRDCHQSASVSTDDGLDNRYIGLQLPVVANDNRIYAELNKVPI